MAQTFSTRRTYIKRLPVRRGDAGADRVLSGDGFGRRGNDAAVFDKLPFFGKITGLQIILHRFWGGIG